ncbi:chemotaxis protein CheW [Marinobacterium stanieri]|uniref:chemotaxis protein CheA n=1 Tax=Marinobacterium stanieri TaxID=49186 RepID=UPI003A8E10CB
MSVDLSQFIPGFLEESDEGLQVMETSLLALAPGDNETINEVFRAAHSIKGGAGTFGFTGVAEFTHEAETLLDAMRNGSVEVTSARTQLLLQSVDIIRDLLEHAAGGDNALPPEAQALASALAQAQTDSSPADSDSSEAEAPSAQNGEPSAQTEEPPATQSDDLSTGSAIWQISFKADPSLLATGNDPLFLFQALSDLGPLKAQVLHDTLPALSELDPEQLYLQWQLQLDADCSEADVREVFEWVEDDIELEVSRSGANDLSSATDTTQGWQIRLHPSEDLLHTGNDPLLLFASLADLGRLDVQADFERLPDLALLDPSALYLDWSLTLYSECDEAAIREVFEWVEDEVELKIQPLTPAVAEPEEDAIEAVPETAAEPSAAEPSPAPQIAPAPRPAAPAAKAKPAARESSIRVDTGKVDSLVDRVGELVITQAMLLEVSQALEELEHPALEELQKGLLQLERNTRELQEDVMRIRMLPISFVFNRFPRLVHDVSQQLGKQVELHLEGEHTELDKTVLEKIGDPLVHLVRNGLDHGLEGPEERQAAGKSATGHLWLTAFQQGGSILIEIRDDGRGLNRDRIRSKAIERGLIDAQAQLSDQEVDELIFLPGFSTAEQVSDLSGRGVGMDVVRRNIESLGGSIELLSNPGVGSCFTIRLPLTLAIMDGQLVRLDQDPYVIPLISIVETLQATQAMLISLAGNRCLLHFRDEYLPLLRLTSAFGLAQEQPLQPGCIVVVVESGGQKAGLVVDELMGQQQTVIKSLEQNYRRVQGLSGATILGDGSVALILDIAGLISRNVDADTALIARQKNEQQEAQA